MWDMSMSDANASMSGGGGSGGGGFFKGDGDPKAAGGSKQGNNETRNLIAVSLNQIANLTVTDMGLVIQRQRVSMVQVLGRVESVNEQSTKTSYFISDGSGPTVEVVLWRTGNEDGMQQNSRSSAMPIVMENTYVKVFGQVRHQANGPSFVVAFKVRPLTELNELSCHLLEVLQHNQFLQRQKAMVLAGKKSGPPVGKNGNSGIGGLSGASLPGVVGMNEAQKIVLRVIAQSEAPEGISRDEIISSLKSLPIDSVRKAIEFLSNEGHIYSTLDDNHFKATEF